jgi:hypothetical protein
MKGPKGKDEEVEEEEEKEEDDDVRQYSPHWCNLLSVNLMLTDLKARNDLVVGLLGSEVMN